MIDNKGRICGVTNSSPAGGGRAGPESGATVIADVKASDVLFDEIARPAVVR